MKELNEARRRYVKIARRIGKSTIKSADELAAMNLKGLSPKETALITRLLRRGLKNLEVYLAQMQKNVAEKPARKRPQLRNGAGAG